MRIPAVNTAGRFNNSSNHTSFNISKAKSFINIYVNEVYLDENIRIYANLSRNATGNVLFSMEDYYSPRNKSIVDSVCSWLISPLKSGQYTINAQYGGDNNYLPSDATFILNVSQYKSILKVKITDFTLNDRVIAEVELTSVNGDKISGKVSLSIGEKIYSIPVNNGKGSLVIGKFNVGQYVYHALYAGSDAFSKSSDEGSFKISENLFNTTLIVNNFTKYYGSDDKFFVYLQDDNSMPITQATIKINLIIFIL